MRLPLRPKRAALTGVAGLRSGRTQRQQATGYEKTPIVAQPPRTLHSPSAAGRLSPRLWHGFAPSEWFPFTPPLWSIFTPPLTPPLAPARSSAAPALPAPGRTRECRAAILPRIACVV